jgi:mevalonate kinase
MVTRMLVIPERENEEPYSADFLIEQQLRFSEDEQEFIEGDVSKLKQEVAKLLVSYINIMIRTKKTLNVSYGDVEDRVFKLKEAEKYSFTDRLRDMSEEERTVDTILKHHKLGPLYSIGLSKGIKEYDPENFDHDKKVAEKVAEIQNKLKRNRVQDRDLEIETDDALEEINAEREIDLDVALDMNMTDDYNDGDPWGEEEENSGDYD